MRCLEASRLSNKKSQILLLFLAPLLLYLPAVSGAIISIDDAGILRFYSAEHLRLIDVLRPGQGYYYRPLIELSYFLDSRLLGQAPPLLHLENVLIHAANTVLLFLLACRLAPAAPRVPFFASLIFAAHPVNCEAVSWIAGRTDPLATLFVLAAALVLCRALECGRVRYTVLSVFLMLVGAMAKETALLFIPASLLLVWFWPRIRSDAPYAAVKLQLKTLFLLYAVIVVALAALFAYRAGSHGNSLAKLVAGNMGDPASTMLLSGSILGFYLKKMLVPWPLSFAITTVAGWYLFIAAAALSGLLLVPRKNPYFVCLLTGLLFLLPAVLVGAFEVAWTVAAERYLYLPSAFFSLGLTGYLHLLADRLTLQRAFVPLLALCVLVLAAASADRSRVWRSNLALFTDAVSKNPGFANLRNELAAAYIQAERIPEAEKQLAIASTLAPSPLARDLIRGNQLLIRLRGKTPEEGREIIKATAPFPQLATEFLGILRKYDYAILKDLPKGAPREAVVFELIAVNQELHGRTRDPLLLYNNGQLYLDVGQREKAAGSFARSYQAAPDDAYYKGPARQLALRLGGRLP